MDKTASPWPEIVHIFGVEPVVRYTGTVKRNCETNEEYTAFYGIPYAKIPEGLKRYQAPESLPKYEGGPIPTYKADVVTNKCSAQIVQRRLEGSANCLYLNIFVPQRPEVHKNFLPVLVYFHGGEFTSGSSDPDTYTPDSIVQHGVIFITVNYRLGLDGFLNWHSKICPGNAGLKDQVKALQWIRDNIGQFQGDTVNITISGSGSGGTCVNLHLVSPMSKGLFHKAIIHSGGIYSACGYRGHQREMKNALLDDYDCWSDIFFDEEDQELQQIRANEVLLAVRKIRHPYSLTPLYGPTTETIEEGAFIYGGVEEMMKNVEELRIPIMAGINENEGCMVFANDKDTCYESWIYIRKRFLRFLVDTFRWHPETAARFVNQIREKYGPEVELMTLQETKLCFAKLVHDVSFRRFYDNFKFGPEKTSSKNLYVYQFAHCSQLCRVKRDPALSSFPDITTHEDDLKYLYCPTSLREQYEKYIAGDEEQNRQIKQAMNHICSLWANFCKTGIPKSDFAPDVEWRRHTEEKPCYLRISDELILKEEALGKDDWDWLNAIVNDQPTVQSRPPTP